MIIKLDLNLLLIGLTIIGTSKLMMALIPILTGFRAIQRIFTAAHKPQLLKILTTSTFPNKRLTTVPENPV